MNAARIQSPRNSGLNVGAGLRRGGISTRVPIGSVVASATFIIVSGQWRRTSLAVEWCFSLESGPGVDRRQINENQGRRMIAESIKPMGQIRPDIEDEGGDDKPKCPECRQENTEGARQGFTGGHRRSVDKGDCPEAQQRQADEGEIDPIQTPNERWQRRQMTAQIDSLRHRRSRPHQSQMQRAGDLKQCRAFHGVLSGGADYTEKRQNDIVDEQRMKQPNGRPDRASGGENPAAQTETEPQPPASFCSLEQEAKSLDQKIDGGQTITASGQQRDDRFMNQTRDEKDGQRCATGSDASPQRQERERMREFMECRVPAPSPKVRQRRRQNRCPHDGPGIDSDPPPYQRQQVKQAKMQQKNETEQAQPRREQRRLDPPDHSPEQRGAEKDLQHCLTPFDQARLDSSLRIGARTASSAWFGDWRAARPPVPSGGHSQKLPCVHAGPRQQIGQRAPEIGLRACFTSLPPGEQFASEKYCERHRPHESPGGQSRLQNQNRKHGQRQPIEPGLRLSAATRARPALSPPGDPAIAARQQRPRSGQPAQGKQRPTPPRLPGDPDHGFGATEHVSRFGKKPHLFEQIRHAKGKSLRHTGGLERPHFNPAPPQPSAKPPCHRHAEGTFPVVKQPTLRRLHYTCIWNFRIHRNIPSKKFQPPRPITFSALSPSLTNLTMALLGHLRTCRYQEVVVSKKSRSARNRSSVYLSLCLSFSASTMHSRNRFRVGSISRRLRSSSTTRNISHTSFIDSKWSRLSFITWTSLTIPHPCNSFRLVLTFERATPNASAICSAFRGCSEM